MTGLEAYLDQAGANQQQGGAQIQQLATVQTLQQHFQQSAEMSKARQIIQSEKDPEKVIPALIQIGPTGAAMAEKYATALKAANDIALTRKLTSGDVDMKNPDTLDALGVALKRPEYMTHAERMRALKDKSATLDTMRDAPQDLQAGTPVAGTTMETSQAIPAAERPAFDRVAAASAQGQTVTSGQQPGDVTPTGGGMFSSLMQSKIPQIAQQAKELQKRLNTSGTSVPPQYWEGMQSRLAAQETALTNRQQPLVSIIGPDGNAVLAPRSEAAGKTPASGAELPALSGPSLKSAGSQAASGMPVTQVVPGYGRTIGARRESVRGEAINQIKEQNPGMDDVAAGQELANRQIDYAAGKKSVGQLTTMLGSTRQAVYQLDFNVKKTSEAMAKLPSSDLSPVINAMARGVEKWTGDPAYSELFYFMHAAAMESARILQGGQASIAQLHAGAAEEAKKWASANFTTPAAWNQGVAPAMMSEGAERIKTFERAIQRQRIGGNAPPVSPGSPSPVTAPQQYPTATGLNGQKIIFKDGKWQNQ